MRLPANFHGPLVPRLVLTWPVSGSSLSAHLVPHLATPHPGSLTRPLPGSTPSCQPGPLPPLPPGPIPSPSPGRDGDLQALWVINVVEFLCRLHLDLKTGQHWGRDGTSRLSALGLALGAPTLTPSSSYRTPSPRTQQRIPAVGHLHSGLLSSTALYCGEGR